MIFDKYSSILSTLKFTTLIFYIFGMFRQLGLFRYWLLTNTITLFATCIGVVLSFIAIYNGMFVIFYWNQFVFIILVVWLVRKLRVRAGFRFVNFAFFCGQLERFNKKLFNSTGYYVALQEWWLKPK